jgi:dynein light intermediate chain
MTITIDDLVITPPESLLKYDAPEILENFNATKRRKLHVPTEPNPQQPTIDFLDTILPPRRFVQHQIEFQQHASLALTTRADVVKLEEQLDQALKERKARDKGICPIRHSLYEDCMNEIIRQVALELHERGTLLRDLRDEINLTIDAYQALYESAVTQGIRKAIHQEQDKIALKQANDTLEAEIRQFEEKIGDVTRKMEEAQRNDEQDNMAKEKDHLEKAAALKAENAVLREKLEALLVPLALEKAA